MIIEGVVPTAFLDPESFGSCISFKKSAAEGWRDDFVGAGDEKCDRSMIHLKRRKVVVAFTEKQPDRKNRVMFSAYIHKTGEGGDHEETIDAIRKIICYMGGHPGAERFTNQKYPGVVLFKKALHRMAGGFFEIFL